MKKSSGSSWRGKRHDPKQKGMRISTRNHDQEVNALLRLRGEQIDTSEIPEVKDWSTGVVGRFYRPKKESVTIRLDADVVAWLKAEGPGYQTRVNALLRDTMIPKRAARNFPKKSEGKV